MAQSPSLGSQWLTAYRRGQAARTTRESVASRAGAAVSRVVSSGIVVPGGHVSQSSSGRHVGTDIGASLGSPILAGTGLRITGVTRMPGETGHSYGLYVTALILSGVNRDKEIIVAHLDRALVTVGQTLRSGQQIGTVGRSGTYDPHAHLELVTAGAPIHFASGSMTSSTAIDPGSYFTQGLASTSAQVLAGLRAPATVTVPSAQAPASSSLGSQWLAAYRHGTTARTAAAQPVVQATASGLQEPAVTAAPASGLGTTPSGAQAYPGASQTSREASAAAAPASDPLGLQAMVDRLGEPMKRAGYIGAGFGLVMIGLVMLILSYREQIGMAAAKYGGAAVGAAAGNPLATAAVIAPVIPP